MSNPELIPLGELPEEENTLVPTLKNPTEESLYQAPEMQEKQTQPDAKDSSIKFPAPVRLNTLLKLSASPGKRAIKQQPEQPFTLRPQSNVSKPVAASSREQGKVFAVVPSNYLESGTAELIRLPPVE